MNTVQAKFILQAYRPSGRDAGNAVFCEALQQARTDPALGAWFANEQAFDAAVASRLTVIVPPTGLREAILAGARVSRSASPSWWRRSAPLALAASLALLLTAAGIFWSRGAGALQTNLDEITRFALADPMSAHGGPHADRLGAFGAWLEKETSRIGDDMAVDLAALKTQGCRTISVAGHEVFEICFNRGGEWFHIYIAERAGFLPLPQSKAYVYKEDGRHASVAWADRRCLYVVVGDADQEALRQLL